MDPSRFDAVAKRLAIRLSRRAALRAGGVGLAAAAGAGQRARAQGTPAAAAQMAANNATLFVQTATGGTFAPNPKAGPASSAGTPTTARHGSYLLTLTGHNGETIAFSDRPQRRFGEVKTPQFFKSMGFTPINPPNVALVADVPGQPDAVVLLELLNPTYAVSSQTLTYEADLLGQYPNARGSALTPLASRARGAAPVAAFGPASLFIDDCPDIDNCYYQLFTNVGPVPGGPVGTCWSWAIGGCAPCSGQGLGYYADRCNSTYPACNNLCNVWIA